MNLKQAAQLALEYIEQNAIISGIPIRDALRAALTDDAMQRLTDEQQEMEKTHASVDNEYTTVKPLTDEQLESIEHKAYLATISKGKPMGNYATELMRAIERAHGIGEEE